MSEAPSSLESSTDEAKRNSVRRISNAERMMEERRKASQEEMELKKQAKLAEFLGTEKSSKSVVSENAALFAAEEERRKASQEEMELLKQAKLAEFLGTEKSSKSVVSENAALFSGKKEENDATVQQQQRKRNSLVGRWANVLEDEKSQKVPTPAASSGSSFFNDNPPLPPVAAAAVPAAEQCGSTEPKKIGKISNAEQLMADRKKASQEEMELAKQAKLAAFLGKDKCNASTTVVADSAAVFSGGRKGSDTVPTSSTNQKVNSLVGRWETNLTDAQRAEQDKFNMTKNQTISQFRSKEEGFVKKKIGEWEELIMQTVASKEMAEETFQAALMIAAGDLHSPPGSPVRAPNTPVGNKDMHRSSPAGSPCPDTPISYFIPSCGDQREADSELFVSGDTHLYDLHNSSFHPPNAVVTPDTLAEYKSQFQKTPMVLPCGVYTSQGESSQGSNASKESGSSDVDVVSLVMTAGNDLSYIALTVIANTADTSATNLNSPPVSFGVKKLVVFEPNGEKVVLETMIHLISHKGTWTNVASPLPLNDDTVDAPVDEEAAAAKQLLEQQKETERLQVLDDELVATEQAEQLAKEKEVAALEERMSFDDVVAKAERALLVDLSPKKTIRRNSASKVGDESEVEASPALEKSEVAVEQVEQTPSADEGTDTWRDLTSPAFTTPMSEIFKTPLSNDPMLSTSQSADESKSNGNNAARKINSINADFEEEYKADSGAANGAASAAALATPANIDDDVQNPTSTPVTVASSVASTPAESNYGTPLAASGTTPLRETDTDAEDSTPYYHTKSATTIHAVPSEYIEPICVNSADANSALLGGNDSWNVSDEVEDIDLPPYAGSDVAIQPISTITSISCSSNWLLLQHNKPGATVITGTLKHTTVNSHCHIHGEKIFEYIKGVSKSGWLNKWPNKSRGIGLRTRRFFILRGEWLLYPATRPQNEDELEAEFALNSLQLTANSTAQLARHHLWPCVQVTTPSDTIWMKCDNKEDDAHWVEVINKAIETLARKPVFLTRPKIESAWHHESDRCSIIAMDALSSKALSTYTHAALFCTESEDLTESHRIYSIDFGAQDFDRKQLEIVTADNSVAFVPSKLECMKLGGWFNGLMVVGGSGGFIGVCSIGHLKPFGDEAASEGQSFLSGVGEEVMFCTIPEAQKATGVVTKSQNSPKTAILSSKVRLQGHDALSTVQCLAVGLNHCWFVSGDSKGGVGLWEVYYDVSEDDSFSEDAEKNGHVSRRKSSSMAPVLANCALKCFLNVNDLKKRAVVDEGVDETVDPPETVTTESTIGVLEGVNNIQFLPDEEHVVVSTNQRFILLKINRIFEHVGSSGGNVGGRKDTGHQFDMPSPISSALHTPPPSKPSRRRSSNMRTNDFLEDRNENCQMSFSSWAVLDRCPSELTSIFCISWENMPVPPGVDAAVPDTPGDGVGEQSGNSGCSNRITVWKIVSGDEKALSETYAMTTKAKTGASTRRSSFTKFVNAVEQQISGDNASSKGMGDVDEVNETSASTLYRFKWTEQMWTLAVQTAQLIDYSTINSTSYIATSSSTT